MEYRINKLPEIGQKFYCLDRVYFVFKDSGSWKLFKDEHTNIIMLVSSKVSMEDLLLNSNSLLKEKTTVGNEPMFTKIPPTFLCKSGDIIRYTLPSGGATTDYYAIQHNNRIYLLETGCYIRHFLRDGFPVSEGCCNLYNSDAISNNSIFKKVGSWLPQ